MVPLMCICLFSNHHTIVPKLTDDLFLIGLVEKVFEVQLKFMCELIYMVSESRLDTPIWFETEYVNYFVPKDANCVYLRLPQVTSISNIEQELCKAIDSPLNSPSLKELVRTHYQRGDSIVILVDDNTRPNIHTRVLLPLLEKKLIEYDAAKSDIRIMIATGTHTPPTPAQIKESILKELYEEWKDRLWVHDCDDLSNHENLGFSSKGTPILIDKRVLSACIIIPLSDSEYHYFAGVAGSVKLFVPGVSARRTVRVNHSRIFDMNTGFKPECRMGNIKNNVSIQDIREIVQILMENHKKTVLVIDTIIHRDQFVGIFAGNPVDIHENGLEVLSKIRDIRIKEKADLVIVSKPSVDFYQAGKGMNAASFAVKQGGQIVLLAGCRNGVGPDDYLETMNEVKGLPFQEAMQWVIRNKCSETTFEIGIQNAVDLMRILQMTEGEVYVYSTLDPHLLHETFRVKSLEIDKDPQEALRIFVDDFLTKKPNALICVFEDYNILALVSNEKKQ